MQLKIKQTQFNSYYIAIKRYNCECSKQSTSTYEEHFVPRSTTTNPRQYGNDTLLILFYPCKIIWLPLQYHHKSY